MTGNHSVRLIHAAADLGRAHAIAMRLHDLKKDESSKVILEGALLADYSRPFIKQAETSPPINLHQLPADFTDEEIAIHEWLIKLASVKAEQLRNGEGFHQPVADQLLDGLDLDAVIELIFKLRKAVTCELYPNLADDPEGLRLMVGPLRRSE